MNLSRVRVINELSRLFYKRVRINDMLAFEHAILSARLTKAYTKNHHLITSSILFHVPYLSLDKTTPMKYQFKNKAYQYFEQGFSKQSVSALYFKPEVDEIIKSKDLFTQPTSLTHLESDLSPFQYMNIKDTINNALFIYCINKRVDKMDDDLIVLTNYIKDKPVSIYEFEKELYESLTI